MDAGEIIAQVERLTHDRLTYFVRVGYVKPKKVKHGNLYYNEFSQRDLEIIKRAWEYITISDMRVRAAFEKARKEVEDPQLRLPLRASR
jgi:DNA-binding transcriptional MerR regulator